MRFMRAFLPISIAALLVAFINPASADAPQSSGPPDKGKHTWCYVGGFTMSATADAAMTWLRTQTVVQTAYHSTCTATTDVRWSQGSVPGSYANAVCKVRNSKGYCGRYRITLNKAVIDASAYPASQRRKTACHELGHTVGVQHYYGNAYPGSDTTHSCLRTSGVPAPNKSWHTRYGVHHRVVHINPWFN